MLDMFLGVLLSILLGGFGVFAGTHVITFPNALTPGIDLDVHVTVVSATKSVQVEALLQRVNDNYTVSRATAVVTAGIPKLIKLPVSDGLAKSRYKVVVSGSDGLTFRNESAIDFDESSLLIFVQLDKSRYSGGQLVRYRALFIRPNMIPFEGPVTVIVHDADGNMIQKEEFISTGKGVVKGTLQLGLEPVFGEWSVIAKAPIMNKSYRKTFEVRDYVLPKFEVKIILPNVVKDTDSSFDISVKARFTFESDVFGNCTIQIYNPDYITFPVDYTKQIMGVAVFTVTMADIKNNLVMNSKINVRALVSDNATFLTMVNEKELFIDNSRNQITVFKVDKRDYFVPGMIYQTPIIVRQQGKPIGSSGSLRVIPVVYQAQISSCLLNNPPTKWLNITRTIYPEFTVSFDETGFGTLKLKTEIHYNKVAFEFKIGSSRDEFTIYAFSKSITSVIGLSAHTGYAKVGERVRVQADASVILRGFVVFEVFARGILLQSEKLLLSQTKTSVFDLSLSADMVPQTYVVVTHATENGLLLKDHIVLLVDGSPFKNNVSMEIIGTTFKPRDAVQLSFKASPGSTVHVLVEDERNRLLGVNNDVFAHEISSALWPVEHSSNRRRRTSVQENPNGKNNGAIVLTDFYFPSRTPVSSLPLSNPDNLPLACGQTPSGDDGGGQTPSALIQMPLMKPPSFREDGILPVQNHLEDIMRTSFPETWLWEEYDTGLNGCVSVTKTLPDSITTWITSIFATNRNTGFGIPEEKYKIKVKRAFFLTMSTPPSLILGEEFLLQITVFNSLGIRIQVQIQIDRSDDPGKPIPAAVVVDNDKGQSTFAKVTPIKQGILTFTVRARAGDWFTTYATDMLERDVIIRPQGIRKTVNHPRFVTVLSNAAVYNDMISVGKYPNIIQGSQQIYMTVTGDIMTPTATGLQDLIAAPSGCGEQNMVKFAPDVFVTNYLRVTGQLTKQMEKTALSHILSGYQNQLTYKRRDGSYSAFVSDAYGGTWLTAYVLKCFHRAQDLITIDSDVLDGATMWLLARQNDDGSFIEQRSVRYIDHVFSQLRMTAFVVISLIEAGKASRTNQFPTINNVIGKGIRYLESKVTQINDAYSLSITCYALAKFGSTSHQSCFRKLQTSMISQDGMIYWAENVLTSSTPGQRAPANDIEATAYGLLTYIAIGRHADALPIVKWLASQRNPQGGFKTTQDTVISVQALTEYSLQLFRYNPNPSRVVQIQATAIGYAHTYSISNTNYNVSHRFEVPPSLTSLNVTVSGNGLAVFDVVETFYVSKDQDHKDISVNVTILSESINVLKIRPALSWKGVSTSNLLMMEIEMPSGFGADLEFVKNQSSVRKLESHGQMLIIYFNSLASGKSVHIDVKLYRVDPVVGNQACHITVYDYYEPEKQSVTTYESGILKKANICNVCPLCLWCTQGPQH